MYHIRGVVALCQKGFLSKRLLFERLLGVKPAGVKVFWRKNLWCKNYFFVRKLRPHDHDPDMTFDKRLTNTFFRDYRCPTPSLDFRDIQRL